jgi:hypothetical protein
LSLLPYRHACYFAVNILTEELAAFSIAGLLKI